MAKNYKLSDRQGLGKIQKERENKSVEIMEEWKYGLSTRGVVKWYSVEKEIVQICVEGDLNDKTKWRKQAKWNKENV